MQSSIGPPANQDSVKNQTKFINKLGIVSATLQVCNRRLDCVERLRALVLQLRLAIPTLTSKELELAREELAVVLGLVLFEMEKRPKPRLVIVRKDEDGGD